MSLFPVFEWFQNSGLTVAMRSSRWLFPIIACVHLMGLAVIGGAVLVVDLRLLGFGLWRQPVAQVARDAQRWLLLSLLVMLPTGFLLFMSKAVQCYTLPAFWIKMVSLFLALAFTFAVRRKVVMADETRISPVFSKLVALVSLSLWSSVAIAGKWIGVP
jgi:hypothetical protein